MNKIIHQSIKKGDGFLRNGYIKNIEFMEWWISDINEVETVMINAGNKRTGLLNGYMTVDLESLVSLSRKLIKEYDAQKGQLHENETDKRDEEMSQPS